MKKTPLGSLVILFLTDFTLGWRLVYAEISLLAWCGVVVALLLLAAALTAPLSNTKSLILRWFRSDAGAFLSILTTAFFSVILVAWLHLFASGLVLFSAGALARLDIQTSGLKKWQAFSLLSSVSLMGLALGCAAKFFIFNQP